MALRLTENRLSRRAFLRSTAATGLLAVGGGLAMPGISRAADRPVVTHGVQSGDVGCRSCRAVVAHRPPGAAVFEWSTTESFSQPDPLPTLTALPENDYTVKIMAEGLPSDQEIFYRVRFADLADAECRRASR